MDKTQDAAILDMTDLEFADYLDMVGNDHNDSGSLATAEDYYEAATRIRELTDE